MTLILLTIVTVAIAMLIMAVGAIVARKSLRGSCGGLSVRGADGEPLNCEACPYRDEFPDCENAEGARPAAGRAEGNPSQTARQ